jgi:Ran GTPase-activating protein (RanGAP) involved in mRNA processing and transport
MSKSVPDFFVKKNNNNLIVTCIKINKEILYEITKIVNVITELDLSRCNICEDRSIFCELVKIFSNCNMLETLKLSLNRINSDDGIIIAEALINCPNLKKLDFSNNNLSLYENYDKTELLIKMFQKCTSLIDLNLIGNTHN